MKKGVVELTVFVLVLSVLLSSGIFAVAPDSGKCKIVAKADCDTPDEGYVLVGLSAATNAHTQAWVYPNNDYPYVLCCNFGDGNRNCNADFSNKVVGLSSLTNAHAEINSLDNYKTVKICYEDMQCLKSTTGCTESMGVEVVNLSSDTNAHVGTGAGFQTAICCKSSKFLSTCTITAATWNLQEAIPNQGVRLEVTGSGLECDNQAVSFEVREADVGSSDPVTTNPVSVGFVGDTAIGLWYAEDQDDGLLGGDPEYFFNASIVRSIPSKSLLSTDPKLSVTSTSIEDACSTISICGDYPDQGQCESDASLCDVAVDSSMEGVDCTSAGFSCACSWDTAEAKCEFSYTEIEPGPCENGYTLCSSASGVNYCYAGSACPSGQTPPSDNDGLCEVDDSCASSDCENGDQASCASGMTCQNGACYSASLPVEAPVCSYGFTLCRNPASGINYCYPGTSCPSGNNPISDGDKKCEIGEGCLSGDCNNSDQDSCSPDTYCSSGKCASVQAPIELGVLGGCKITQTIEKDCDEEPAGYKILKWTGVWTEAPDPANPRYQRCIAGGSSNVPCPAEVQLPFFDYYEVAITVAIIALVYISLIFKRKFRKRKK